MRWGAASTAEDAADLLEGPPRALSTAANCSRRRRAGEAAAPPLRWWRGRWARQPAHVRCAAFHRMYAEAIVRRADRHSRR